MAYVRNWLIGTVAAAVFSGTVQGLPDPAQEALLYRTSAGYCVASILWPECRPCRTNDSTNPPRSCFIYFPLEFPAPRGVAILAGELHGTDQGDGGGIEYAFWAYDPQPQLAATPWPPWPAAADSQPNRDRVGAAEVTPLPVTSAPVDPASSDTDHFTTASTVSNWVPGDDTDAWSAKPEAVALAAVRSGVWDLPPAKGSPVLGHAANLPTPIERILACTVLGAADPLSMWRCSGLFVGHAEFAACVSGAYCMPSARVPPEIRATGLALVPYIAINGKPIPHLAAAREQAHACDAARLEGEAAFVACMVPRLVPAMEARALLCAQTLVQHANAADPTAVRLCAVHAEQLRLDLPPPIGHCVDLHPRGGRSLAGCLAQAGLPPAARRCQVFLAGDDGEWLTCLHEIVQLNALRTPAIECLLGADVSEPSKFIGCATDAAGVPSGLLQVLNACLEDGADRPTCLTKAILGQARVADCVDPGPANLMLCAIKESTGPQVAEFVRCASLDDVDALKRCMARSIASDPKLSAIVANCPQDVEYSAILGCVLGEYDPALKPIAHCAADDDPAKCLVTSSLGRHAESVSSCTGDVDALACLDALGVPVSNEADLVWRCRDQPTSEDTWACLAGGVLGEREQQALQCARGARDADDALLCLAEAQLGQQERAILQCARDGQDTKAKLVCAIGTTVLSEQDAKAVACATRGDLVGAALCMSDTGLTPEQEMAVACAATTGGEPTAWATCTGGKLLVAELTKCVTNGIGTEGGCFGESNDLRRAVETAFNDLTKGPGEGNDLVGFAREFHALLEHTGFALGGLLGQSRGGVFDAVLTTKAGLAVVVGSVSQTVGNAINDTRKNVECLFGICE